MGISAPRIRYTWPLPARHPARKTRYLADENHRHASARPARKTRYLAEKQRLAPPPSLPNTFCSAHEAGKPPSNSLVTVLHPGVPFVFRRRPDSFSSPAPDVRLNGPGRMGLGGGWGIGGVGGWGGGGGRDALESSSVYLRSRHDCGVVRHKSSEQEA